MSRVKIAELLKVCDNLKHLKRTGWVKRGVPEPETVACHMYRMAILAMALEGEIENLDVIRALKMSLVHDIGESIVGDITPHCGISQEDKFNLENEAMKRIASYVPNVGDEWMQLWNEYEEATSLTATVVKHLDKFDMVAQAWSYEQKHDICLEEFFTSTAGFFKMEPFLTWDRELRQEREIQKKRNDNL
ncbi:unnamed protein product [Caenorhabditis auriculariae]|uniref:5'-deoxynucleotidase HDDC2 n=1 Tax=Caenorhabditis auriculariae TaxID=2777116 RepID=A0A8S1HAI5_9PELO|nr:unnamed protein product [Caenorhabditis auriculariae]